MARKLDNNFFLPPPPPSHSGDQNKFDWKWKKMKSVQNHPKWQDDLNGRQPQWKMTSMEDDLNGRRLEWKTTSMEDDLNGRRPK